MPTGSLPGTTTAPVPPGIFATSMPPIGPCKTNQTATSATTFNANNQGFHVNGSNLNRGSYDVRTPSPSVEDNTELNLKSDLHLSVEDRSKHSNKVLKSHKASKRTYPDSYKKEPPLKMTIRLVDGDHSAASHSPSRITEPYMFDKHDEFSFTDYENSAKFSHKIGNESLNNNYSRISDYKENGSKSAIHDEHPSILSASHHSSPKLGLSKEPREEYNSLSSNITQKVPARNQQPLATEENNSIRNVGTCTFSSATLTEPDLLGPCEPGSRILLDGVVWVETPGMLVLNVNWRGRSYVGSLIDATKNSMGPSCADKSLSALSLLRSRNWRNGPGFHRNRPTSSLTRSSLVSPRLHHGHLHHHYHLAGLGSLHGSVTTRSATAAANSSDDRQQTPEGSKPGPKRRTRRSGKVFGTPSSQPLSPEGQNRADESTVTEIVSDRLLSPTNSTEQHQSFKCPFDGCEKRFSSVISLRFHTQMGHASSSQSNGLRKTGKSSTTLISKPVDTTKSVHVRKRRKLVSGNDLNQINSSKLQETSPTLVWKGSSPNSTTRKPPKLAKVENNATLLKQQETKKNKGNSLNVDEISRNNFITSSEDLDDELPPPKLVVEEERVPPVSSPAYSDISEDGGEPNDGSSRTNVDLLASINLHPPALLAGVACPPDAPIYVPTVPVGSSQGLLTMGINTTVCRPWIGPSPVDPISSQCLKTPLTVSTMYFNTGCSTPSTILGTSPGISAAHPHVRSASPSIVFSHQNSINSPATLVLNTGPNSPANVSSGPQYMFSSQQSNQTLKRRESVDGATIATTNNLGGNLNNHQPQTGNFDFSEGHSPFLSNPIEETLQKQTASTS